MVSPKKEKCNQKYQDDNGLQNFRVRGVKIAVMVGVKRGAAVSVYG